MRKLIVIAFALTLLCMHASVFAAITGGRHDLSGTESMCESCHTPHDAGSAYLWGRANTVASTLSGQALLCYSCHDGTITSAGATTAFDDGLEQHIGVGTDDCSGNGTCHDVHTENPNQSGKFLVAGVGETNGSYCETCHDATQFTGAETLGDHTAGITHFTNGTTFTCNQCHTVHGATAQTTNPGSLTNPILLANNQSGSTYGDFCISCHQGTIPTAAVPGTGGVASGDPFDYSESTTGGTETKHPTTSAGVGGCNMCHDVHDPTGSATNSYILAETNANSAFCVSCHDGDPGPAVGVSHPAGVAVAAGSLGYNSGLTPPLPWSDEISAVGNGEGGVHTGTVADQIVCETCHSVHRNGFTGTDNEYFLRNAMGSGDVLCRECHDTN